MFTGGSLASRLLGAILISTLVISAVGAVVAASVFRQTIERRQLAALDAYIGERAEGVNALFDYVQEAHRASAAALSVRLEAADPDEAALAFDRLFPEADDGSRRSIDAIYEGEIDAAGDWRSHVGGIFTPPGPLDRDRRALLHAAYTVVDRGGEMYRERIDSLYFYTFENQLVISAYNRPDDLLFYRRTAPADWDFRGSSLVRLVDPERNPDGVFVCDELSPVLYDPDSRALTTGCFTPVDLEGRRIGAFGTTINVAEYFAAALADTPEGGENLFIDDAGHLISHTELLDGTVTADRVEALAARLDLPLIVNAIGDADHGAALARDRGVVVTWSRIRGPGWWFVSIVDHSHLRAEANRQALLIFGVAALGVIIQSLIIAALLQRLVLHPLTGLNRAFGGAPKERVAAPQEVMTSRTEIGELARSLQSFSEARESVMSELETRVSDRTRELEKARDARGEFLAHLSHELRTPLNAIINLAGTLEEQADDGQPREMARLIRESGDTLNHLLGDVLDMSKIEAGKLEIAPKWIDPAELLSDMRTLFAVAAAEKGIELRLSGLNTLPGQVYTDPFRLRQCLTNLLSNAIKFTAEGSVEIRASTRLADGGGRIAIEVEDTGPGMTRDTLGKLFTPFTQAQSDTASEFGGTGLGLSITRELARLLGGDVSARSDGDRGSIFRLEFFAPVKLSRPASPANAPSAPDRVERSIAGFDALRVLLVEDNSTNRFVVTSMLQKYGFRFTEAETGLEALEKLGEAEFDLVLMDVQMPEMDGLEATARIRDAAGPIADLPIVALTAHVAPDDIRRCLDAGMDAYASKPLSAEALVEAILNALRKRGRIS